MAVLDRLETALSTLPLAPENVHRVINVGCGRFLTAQLLRHMYPQAAVIGIDPAWWVLKPAPDVWKIAAEGQHLPLAQTIAFDLIVIRHPDINQGHLRWQRVCSALCQRLAPNGVLLVSCYTRLEWQTCRNLLQKSCLNNNGRQPLSLSNKTLPPVDLSGQDRFLLAVQRCQHPNEKPDN